MITGGRGFIGTNLIEYLSKKKIYDIHCVDKISYSSVPTNLLPYESKKINFHKINLCNILKTKELISKIKPEIIVNLASESHVDRSIDTPVNFLKNNNGIILSLLEACKKKIFLRKFINVSTDEIYGGNNKRPVTENNKFYTSSPYSASKAFGNLLGIAYRETFKLPLINVQSCNNFGNYQFTEKFIPRSINLIENDKPIEIYSKGENIREWIYVKDFCSAIHKVVKVGKIGNSYNVGSSKRLSNNELIKILINEHSKLTSKEISDYKLKYVKDRLGHDFKYSLNSEKIKKELKWNTLSPFRKSLRLTISWYLENKKWINYCNSKYSGSRLGIGK